MAVLCGVQCGEATVVAWCRYSTALAGHCIQYVRHRRNGTVIHADCPPTPRPPCRPRRPDTPVTGSLFIYNILHTTPPLAYVLAYTISSLALNLTATGCIAGRLLLYRYRIVSQLGRRHGQHYVSIVGVVVESAAMYTSFLLIVIIVYVLGSPGANILQQVIEQVQVSKRVPVCALVHVVLL